MSTATWSKSSNQQPQKSEVKTNSAGQKKDVSTKKPTVSNTTAGEKPKSDVAVKPSKENEISNVLKAPKQKKKAAGKSKENSSAKSTNGPKKAGVKYSGPKALHLSCREGSVAMIKATVEKYPEMLNSQVKFDLTEDGSESMMPIHVGAYTCKIHVVEALLELGADVNARDSDGTTALHVAACLGNLDLVQLLIKHKADIDIADIDNGASGATALHWASIMGHVRVVQYLLNHGAKEVKNSLGMTPLHFAASVGPNERNAVLSHLYPPKVLKISRPSASNYVKTIRLLADAGFDLNAKDNNGSTALHMAASVNFLDRIQTLLAAGADPTVTFETEVVRNDGSKEKIILAPYNVAMLRNYEEAAAMLQA